MFTKFFVRFLVLVAACIAIPSVASAATTSGSTFAPGVAPVRDAPETLPPVPDAPPDQAAKSPKPKKKAKPRRIMGVRPHPSKAKLVRRGRYRGLVVAPLRAPRRVKRLIRAANKIARKPYVWGGGHASFSSRGYDCSGSVSYALHGGRLLSRPLPSYGFYRWGKKGRGKWVTVYTRSGHMYMVVAGLRFDTSGKASTGSRWQSRKRSTRGYMVRHPKKL